MQCNWEYIYQANNPEQKSTQHRSTETEDTRTITQQEKAPTARRVPVLGLSIFYTRDADLRQDTDGQDDHARGGGQ